MAIQIRNTVFDVSDAARRAEVATLLAGATTSVYGVKKSPSSSKSSNNVIVYEIVFDHLVLRLEMSASSAPADILALEALIPNLFNATDGWEIGTDQDLKAG